MMRKILIVLFLLGLLATQALGANDDGLIPVPPLKERVTDLTDTLSSEEKGALTEKLKNFEKASGSQIAVLIIPTTKPEEIEQYSIRVVEQWKLGRKGIADGILLIIAKDDHKMKIEVGRGLEGAIPDAIAKRIISEIISPQFKEGNFYGGIDAGVDKMIGIIGGEMLPEPQQNQLDNLKFNSSLVLFLIITIFIAAFLASIISRLIAAITAGGLTGLTTWLMFHSLLVSGVLGFAIFLIILLLRDFFLKNNYSEGWNGGYYNRGGHVSGGSNSDSFSGGGGDFGGGGASGDW